jgi:cell division septal protein FtsQ
VAVVFLAACAIGTWNALTSSDTFRIVAIQTPSDSPFEIPEGVRGQNLWTIDLQSLAAMLQAQQPQYRWVRVTRVPPHTLRIDARERIPAAQVQLAQWHLVDDDGYIFKESSAKPFEGRIMLRGIGETKAPLKLGRRNEGERLRLGLRLIVQLRQSPHLRGHQLASLDVSDPQQVSFVMDDDIEIRCGSHQELMGQLGRLSTVLLRVQRQSLPLPAGEGYAHIRYVDVRFPEPVIGPRT